MFNLREFNEFNIKKIVQILGYLQRKTAIVDKIVLIKLLFFADRLHLRRHFYLITLDTYYALKNGPAASETLNVINKNDDYIDFSDKEIAKILSKIKIANNTQRIIDERDTDYLSEYEMEALDFSCETFGKFSKDSLIEITHDYPEWKRYKNYFENGMGLSKPSKLVNINDFFSNPKIEDSPALQKYFNGVDPLYEDEDYLKCIKEFCLENEAIRNEYSNK
jgi:uncharacterized phage-associated protein